MAGPFTRTGASERFYGCGSALVFSLRCGRMGALDRGRLDLDRRLIFALVGIYRNPARKRPGGQWIPYRDFTIGITGWDSCSVCSCHLGSGLIRESLGLPEGDLMSPAPAGMGYRPRRSSQALRHSGRQR